MNTNINNHLPLWNKETQTICSIKTWFVAGDVQDLCRALTSTPPNTFGTKQRLHARTPWQTSVLTPLVLLRLNDSILTATLQNLVKSLPRSVKIIITANGGLNLEWRTHQCDSSVWTYFWLYSVYSRGGNINASPVPCRLPVGHSPQIQNDKSGTDCLNNVAERVQ